jgi:hypothetical protein
MMNNKDHRSSVCSKEKRSTSITCRLAVWVAKQQEVIDAAWFSQPTVDLLTILQGQLRVEFEQELQPSMVLDPGDLLVLPPHTRCWAFRWPRDRQEATIFLAVYPVRHEMT